MVRLGIYLSAAAEVDWDFRSVSVPPVVWTRAGTVPVEDDEDDDDEDDVMLPAGSNAGARLYRRDRVLSPATPSAVRFWSA